LFCFVFPRWSISLTLHQKKTPKSDEELLEEWKEKYGEKGAEIIRQTVVENVEHYEYLKQFAVKV
jgi:hypothetical protein